MRWWLVLRVVLCEQGTSADSRKWKRWKKTFLLDMKTSFAEYLDPDLAKPETVVIGGDGLDVGGTPVPAMRQQSRRLRITPEDLRRYGYTAGFPGCIHVQRGAGTIRNHDEACGARIDEKLLESMAGRA